MSEAKAGFVYLIKPLGLPCKIGRANDADKRLRALRGTFPFEVEVFHSIATSDQCRTERALHRWFAPKRLQGEWFDLTPEEIAWLRGIGEWDERLYAEIRREHVERPRVCPGRPLGQRYNKLVSARIEPEHRRMLATLRQRWGCNEAEAIRRVIRLAEEQTRD